jgi:hypothetical protein
LTHSLSLEANRRNQGEVPRVRTGRTSAPEWLAATLDARTSVSGVLSDSMQACILLAGLRPSPSPQGPRSSLVIEDNVWPPDELGGDADGGDILVVSGVPAQLIVMPLLDRDKKWS